MRFEGTDQQVIDGASVLFIGPTKFLNVNPGFLDQTRQRPLRNRLAVLVNDAVTLHQHFQPVGQNNGIEDSRARAKGVGPHEIGTVSDAALLEIVLNLFDLEVFHYGPRFDQLRLAVICWRACQQIDEFLVEGAVASAEDG